ncbi:ADP-ribose pyrophosphatase YjhB, NUDIX family [Paractinoplanes atraurantiacus]|uniref:ADP-ribose pyrophosphatase YjhB, NUDIX family n=1 Tax=Paractinoplanes atraurantiacus TaxID=1036182 RepID=A0A285HDS9_9ACTN|nr:ADP-ribose pyrophosphatase YjhB, NUDIX family [Actinoplanes atraurantiacus]
MSFPRVVRAYAYQAFYRLPSAARRRIAGLVAPRYLVGAVAVVRDSESSDPDRILLLRQPPNRGWSLPAGLLKKHERAEIGAARELFEETGVRIAPGDLTPGNPNAIIHPVGVVDTVFFGAVPASTTKLAVDGGEILEAAWFPVDDLPRLTVNTAHLLSQYGIGGKKTAALAAEKVEREAAVYDKAEAAAGAEGADGEGGDAAGGAGGAGDK